MLNPINSSVKFTAETAPRDQKELMMLGRFRLRDLAVEVGMGETAETRASLSNMSVESMAEEILRRLLQIDATGGAAAPAPTMLMPPTPVATTPMPVLLPMAAAPAEAPPPAVKRQRSPTNAASRAADAASPVASVPQDEIVAAIKNLASEIASNTQQLKALVPVLADIQQKQAANLATAQSGVYQAQINTAVSVLIGQQTLQGSPPEIIETALNDLPEILTILGKAQQPGRR